MHESAGFSIRLGLNRHSGQGTKAGGTLHVDAADPHFWVATRTLLDPTGFSRMAALTARGNTTCLLHPDSLSATRDALRLVPSRLGIGRVSRFETEVCPILALS